MRKIVTYNEQRHQPLFRIRFEMNRWAANSIVIDSPFEDALH
jgi:hypothetical protein